MKIEIWSDIVCPFCYIGKRNLDNAIKELNLENVEIIWRSYRLDPEFPAEHSENYFKYLSKRMGISEMEAIHNFSRVVQMAKTAGLDYKINNIKVFNTFNVHRIIQLAKEKGMGNEIGEIFFRSFFLEEKDIHEKNVQLEILKEVGLGKEDLEKAVNDKKYSDAVNLDFMKAMQIGVKSVPNFLINGKYHISGAVPKEQIMETLESISKTEKLEKSNSSGDTCDLNGNCTI